MSEDKITNGDYFFGNHNASEPPATKDDFFRSLGDTNGDGAHNGIDATDIIPTRFNATNYHADLETNGDGVINGADLNDLIPTMFGSGRA